MQQDKTRPTPGSAGGDEVTDIESRSQAAGLESMVRGAPGERREADYPGDEDEEGYDPQEAAGDPGSMAEPPGAGAPAAPGAPAGAGAGGGAAEAEALRLELQQVRAEAARNRDLMMRTIADAQNARRRAEEEVAKERKFGLERFIKALIPVVDSLDMALSMTDRRNPALKSTIEGVEGTLNLFLKELSGFGVERIDPLGQPFDPNYHQAISMAPSADTQANHIMHVMQKGFLLNGRVVRPAMVVVSKGQGAPEAASGNIDVKA